MITAYVGMPGEGKTYCLVDWLYRQMRKGRLGLSQFAVDYAFPLEKISDLMDDSARGAAVSLDEIGRILPARDWGNEDEIEQLVFEIHRHLGIDVGYACQHPAQVSASLRRLTGEWKYPIRVGLDPSKILKAGKKPKWYQKPFGFRITTYYPDPSDDSGMPKIVREKDYRTGEEYAEVHCDHSWTWYHQTIADMYDTTERVYTDAAMLEIKERLIGAKERLLSERWIVEHGVATGNYTRLQRARDDESIRRRQMARKKRPGLRESVESTVSGTSLDLSGYITSLQGNKAQQSTAPETLNGTTPAA